MYNMRMTKIAAYSGFSERLLDASKVTAADHLISLKKKHQTNIWPVIDGVIEVWKKQRPKEWDAFVVDIETTRSATYDKFGASKETKGSGDIRRTLDLPVFFDRAIRALYTVDELPFNKEFFEEVWKRYPMFRVSEKV